jgi:serine phosphatase RsbU (regulator of sigma subunit)
MLTLHDYSKLLTYVTYMPLCFIDIATLELEWSGANNPILMVRNVEFTEIKPNKMPIAIYKKMDRYTLHTKQLQKGDIIYLITNGYPDQFSESKNCKLMSKKLKQMLLETSLRFMDEQHKLLETAIHEWMFGHDKEYKQNDDITLMGIKI